MKRTVLERLEDMLHYSADAENFVEGMTLETLKNDRKTAFALIRAVEVVGEAAKFIPEEIRSQYPHVPWRDITGLRNQVAHAYFGIDYDLLWITVQRDIPELIANLEVIIAAIQKQ
jgi:uncharacterized protein with HEPN domain